ncbi:MAG TPA: cytochrome c [Candidatus Polarisedimenticolia bacterium]|nr:cytochrome c [Candidatus Polarisedimenticolia bacterium]
MTRLIALLAVFLMFAIPALTRSQDQGQQPPPPPKVQPTKSIVVPEAEKNRRNPIPNVPEAIESGRNLFASQCAMCHGVKGDGKGELVERLKLIVPSFADPKVQRQRTDGEWFYILSKGHGEMPAEQRLADQNKWEMILYMRTLRVADKPQK